MNSKRIRLDLIQSYAFRSSRHGETDLTAFVFRRQAVEIDLSGDDAPVDKKHWLELFSR
jgi:hypothetical protein